MNRVAYALALTSGTGLVGGAAALPAAADQAADRGLEVAIKAPTADWITSTIRFDVDFHGGNIRSIELYIDGTRVKQQTLATRDGHGVITFVLDQPMLNEGDHELLVKAFDADGACATATTHIWLGETPQPLAQFTYPRIHQMVEGTVPIQVKIADSVKSPYVSFLLDSQFLALTNYAPFTYNWDSTRVPNGPHTIGIEVFDGDSLARVKALSLDVLVNNPGGLTRRMKDVPDLRKTVAAAPKVPSVPAPRLASPDDRVAPVAIVDALARVVLEAVATARLRTGAPLTTPAPVAAFTRRSVRGPITSPVLSGIGASPAASGRRAALATSPSLVARALASPRLAQPAEAVNPRASRGVATVAPEISHNIPPSLAATAVTLSPEVAAPADIRHEPAAAVHFGNIAARPAASTAAAARANTAAAARGKRPAGKSHGAAAPLRKPRPSVAAPRRTPKRAAAPEYRTLQIAFDNRRIDFDVTPRVVRGLPLAPFRQIFEHTGGIVQWFNRSKTVRAISSKREVQFRIGNRNATVNAEPVRMQRAPFIDRGRAIVPLSFVHDAMNVTIRFDAATGHLFIESNRTR